MKTMPDRDCTSCSKTIAFDNIFCPHCGAQQTAEVVAAPKKPESEDQKKFKQGCLSLLIIGGIGAVLSLTFCSPDKKASSTSAPETSQQQSQPANVPAGTIPGKFIPEIGKMYKTKAGYPVSPTVEELEKGIKLYKDKEAFLNFIMEGGVNLTKPGLHVYYEDNSVWGYVQIRLEGSTVGLWTVRDAIEPL